MKAMCRVALMVVAAALLMSGLPVRVSATETDERIVSSAQKSHIFQTFLKDDSITVESLDGVVTLTGTVAEEPNKLMAQETVESLPGVKSVDNRLEIKGDRGPENSDAWVGMKVKTALSLHRNLSTSKTDVQVKDGVVTLRGDAGSKAQIDLATEYVKDVDGVNDVKNEMTVSKTPSAPDKKTIGEKLSTWGGSIDDASITALVKITLLYHRSTSALHTKVETNNGVVTLTGTTKNAAAKDLATKFVQDVHGVKGVVNNVTIE